MTALISILVFTSVFCLIVGVTPAYMWETRPKLQGLLVSTPKKGKRKTSFPLFRKLAVFNKPLCQGNLGRRIARDLAMAHSTLIPEEFLFIKEILIGGLIVLLIPRVGPDFVTGLFLFIVIFGYWGPELWLRGKVKKAKMIIMRELPDAIDLLTLCVNAGLDFMLALKWVVEKSPPSIMIAELNTMMQEINVGKTRRDAIRDLSAKYDVSELSTFSRTLIQADKMGTSIGEALNILSEDMRLARFRRGEQMALKAPLKMLVPLLLFIFPVVGILVAGPILIDFVKTNPFANLGGGALR
jgi:tight adherence protein C